GAVDLCLDPTNPRVLYATTWRFVRTPYSLESGGEGSGLWKSTDGGETWTELTGNDGLPAEGPFGIGGVTVSPADPRRVYAILEHEKGGVFRSDDAGETWRRVNDERNLRQRAWYYSRIEADPKDADVVYVLNVRFWRSKDGGKSFESIRTPHSDNHDLWIDPADPDRMIEANDGGANVSLDGGRTWTAQDGQPTAQFYRVTTDTHFPYRIYGAQQDNSTVRIASRTDRGSIGERDWEPTAGGESGHLAPHPLDPEIVYGGSYGGDLSRVNHRTGERRAVDVWPDNPMGWGAADLKYRFQWNFPIFFSPHDPDTLYAAGNVLFRTTDEGQTWHAISPDLTRDDASKQGPSGGPITKDNTSVEYYCTIFAALESPHRPGVLWCGSDDGLVHVSQDGGANWIDVTPASMPEWTQINSIEAHPFEPGGLYLAGTRYKLDDHEPYLYRTTDHGDTWTRIDGGIDRAEFTRVVRADPVRRGLLYAGTERGVWISFDDGGRWQRLGGGLPIVPITDLAVEEGDLVAATQGRAFWVLDDLAHLRQLAAEQAEAAWTLYDPEPIWRMRGRSFGRGGTSGRNPPSGAVVRFHVAAAPEEDAEVALEIAGEDAEVLRRWSTNGDGREGGPGKLEVKEGMNRFEWDLEVDGAKRIEGMILWGGRLSGPRVPPGRYTVRLIAPDGVHEAPLEIRKDPRSEATAADTRAQFDFLIDCRDTLTAAHRAIERIRTVRGQIDGALGRAGEAADALKESADALKRDLTAIEEALYQTKNRSPQDPLNFPIRLNNKLAALAGLVASSGDYRPTDQQVAVREELTAAIEDQLDRLRVIETEGLPRFNEAVAAAGVPAVTTEL
ncbi:MAG: WD40/YVTN/BNR-like repeat-containing protein, partial [Planctomycetota bacterium JB042]